MNMLGKPIKVLLLAIAMLFSLTTPVMAHTAADLDNDHVILNDDHSDNLYVWGDTLTVNGVSEKDVVAFGGDVELNGNIGGNLIVAGGNVVVNGVVNGDILVVGGKVVINSNQKGDVRVIGGDVFVSSKTIQGDLVAIAGDLYMNNVTKINGEEIYDTPRSLDSRLFPKTAKELDNLGDSWFNSADFSRFTAATATILCLLFVGIFVGNYFTYLFIIKVFPVIAEGSIRAMRKDKMSATRAGCLTFIVAPILASILYISIVGIPLLGVLYLLGMLVIMFANVYMLFVIGNKLLSLIGVNTKRSWLKLIVGYVALNSIYVVLFLMVLFVPVLGILIFLGALLIHFLLLCWAVGGMLTYKYNKMNVKPETKHTSKHESHQDTQAKD